MQNANAALESLLGKDEIKNVTISLSAKLNIRADLLAQMYLESHMSGHTGPPFPNPCHFPS